MPMGHAVPTFEVSQSVRVHYDATFATAVLILQLVEPLTGKSVSLQQAKGEQGTLIVFMCNHCPFVIHLRG